MYPPISRIRIPSSGLCCMLPRLRLRKILYIVYSGVKPRRIGVPHRGDSQSGGSRQGTSIELYNIIYFAWCSSHIEQKAPPTKPDTSVPPAIRTTFTPYRPKKEQHRECADRNLAGTVRQAVHRRTVGAAGIGAHLRRD